MDKANNRKSAFRKFSEQFLVKGGMDIPFFLLLMAILAIGLVMLLSASYFSAFYYENDSFYYFTKQLVFTVIGLAGMLLISKFDYKIFRLASIIGMAVSVLFLAFVLIKPSGSGDEIKRWIIINLGFFEFSFQPSELAKFAMILFLAHMLDRDNKKLTDPRPSDNALSKFISNISGGKLYIAKSTVTLFIYFLIVVGMSALVLLESHLSGTILMAAIGVMMLWFGEGRARWFAVGSVVAVIVIIYVIKNYDQVELLREYMADRIIAWLDKSYSPEKYRWQTNQSLYAIGSGGFFGAGLGNSKEKYLYVSEPQNDFIFAIVCEELGFVGAAFILLLYAALVLRGVYIAMRAKDRFGTLICLGVVTQLALQVILNVGVVSDLLPNTGIGLPFFSAGGTSMIILLAEMGTVLSVSRKANLPKVYSFNIKLPKKKTKSKHKKAAAEKSAAE